MMLAATAADFYLLTETEGAVTTLDDGSQQLRLDREGWFSGNYNLALKFTSWAPINSLIL